MAKKQDAQSVNNAPAQQQGFPMFGMGMGQPMPAAPAAAPAKSKKKKKLSAKDRQKRIARKERARTLRNRQRYALQNARYRRKIEAIEGRGGIDNYHYSLPEDKKPKRGHDYFFVMRKFVCFLMFLVLLVNLAYFALGVVKVEQIPAQFTALFMETEPKEEVSEPNENEGETGGETEGEVTEGEETPAEADIAANADEAEGTEGEVTEGEGEATEGEGTEGEGAGDVAEGEENAAPTFDGTAYSVMDPIFGFIKYLGNLMGLDLNSIGDSPLYDAMLAKTEAGMAISWAEYIIIAFPVGLILNIIITLVMLIKAFIGMFGRRIFKAFGLGSILMIISAALTAFAGLIFTWEINATEADFGGIMNILIGGLTGVGGFTGGYGLLILLALPLITLILSMFCRRKIPYAIFDTFGE